MDANIFVDYSTKKISICFYHDDGMPVLNQEFYLTLSSRFTRLKIEHGVDVKGCQITASLSQLDTRLLAHILTYRSASMKLYNKAMPKLHYESQHSEKYYMLLKAFLSNHADEIKKYPSIRRTLVDKFNQQNPQLAEMITADVLIDNAYNRIHPGITKEPKLG